VVCEIARIASEMVTYGRLSAGGGVTHEGVLQTRNPMINVKERLFVIRVAA